MIKNENIEICTFYKESEADVYLLFLIRPLKNKFVIAILSDRQFRIERFISNTAPEVETDLIKLKKNPFNRKQMHEIVEYIFDNLL